MEIYGTCWSPRVSIHFIWQFALPVAFMLFDTIILVFCPSVKADEGRQTGLWEVCEDQGLPENV